MQRKRRNLRWSGALVAALLTACGGVDGGENPDAGTGAGACAQPKEIGGTITTEVTIGEECSNWTVTKTLFVDEGGRLIIKPGTTLTFPSGTALRVEGGSLTAEGTASAPILLTGAQKTRGSWQGVNLHDSNSTLNVLAHVTIEYAGSQKFYWAHAPAALALTTSSTSLSSTLSMENTTLWESAGYGLDLERGAVLTSFTGNTLTKNASGAAITTPTTAGALLAGNGYTGNDKDLVMVWNDREITGSVTWRSLGVPFHAETVYVNGSLTVEPGTTVAFLSGAFLEVEGGSLKAQGMADKKIVFTGAQKTRGYWKGIEFRTSDSIDNILEHAVVEYAGSARFYWAHAPANVALTTSDRAVKTRVAISQTELRESAGYGLVVERDTQAAGFTGNTLTRNALGAAHVFASTAHSLLDSSSYSGNDTGKDLVFVMEDNIGTQVTWAGLDVPFRLERFSVLANGHLTVSAGARLEFKAGADLYVEEGALTAVGTAAKPIVFTRAPDVAGKWKGLSFHNSASTQNRLEHVEIRHGGSTKFYWATQAANLALTDSGTGSVVALSNVTLGEGGGLGMWVSDISTVSSCTSVSFIDNASGTSNHATCQ
ncbi:MAG TPA: hypothetical protein VLQ93_08710 [Myxococcaceae bacterium]|nr:hypothetical protein [Myxococcaceae bacterium]